MVLSASFYHFLFRFESILIVEGYEAHFAFRILVAILTHFTFSNTFALDKLIEKKWHCDVEFHVNMFWRLNLTELERSGWVVKLPYLLILTIFTSILGYFAKVLLRTGRQGRLTPIHTLTPPHTLKHTKTSDKSQCCCG